MKPETKADFDIMLDYLAEDIEIAELAFKNSRKLRNVSHYKTEEGRKKVEDRLNELNAKIVEKQLLHDKVKQLTEILYNK